MHAVHKNTQKKRIYLYIIVFFGVIIIINPFNILGSVRGVASTLFLPVNGVGQGFGTSVRDALGVVVHMGDMHEENQVLLQENQHLRAEIAQLLDMRGENDVLRKELGLAQRGKFDLVHAEVVVRDSVGGDQWIMINKGVDDGIQKDMAVVVDEDIFVGYIDTIDKNTSRVRLLTHPESVVNVVNAKSGAEAISRGQHGLSVVVEDIKKGDEVHDGDMFVTSQIGNKFPRGLSVGTAQNISLSHDDLFQSANIIPMTQLDKIRFVSVIKK